MIQVSHPAGKSHSAENSGFGPKNVFESIHTSRAVVSSNVIWKYIFDVFNSFQRTFMSHSVENLFF